MTSIIKVDEIQSKSGNGVSADLGKGQVLEILSSPCDGSSVTVGSGTYSFENITVDQGLTTSYADVTGSSMAYTPPSGTSSVIYNFGFHHSRKDTQVYSSFRFYIDSDEVVYARRQLSADLLDTFRYFSWIIHIGGTPNTNTGRLASWTSAKTLKMQAREYSSSYEGALHKSQHWDGTGTDMFMMPILTITAIR